MSAPHSPLRRPMSQPCFLAVWLSLHDQQAWGTTGPVRPSGSSIMPVWCSLICSLALTGSPWSLPCQCRLCLGSSIYQCTRVFFSFLCCLLHVTIQDSHILLNWPLKRFSWNTLNCTFCYILPIKIDAKPPCVTTWKTTELRRYYAWDEMR